MALYESEYGECIRATDSQPTEAEQTAPKGTNLLT